MRHGRYKLNPNWIEGWLGRIPIHRYQRFTNDVQFFEGFLFFRVFDVPDDVEHGFFPLNQIFGGISREAQVFDGLSSNGNFVWIMWWF